MHQLTVTVRAIYFTLAIQTSRKAPLGAISCNSVKGEGLNRNEVCPVSFSPTETRTLWTSRGGSVGLYFPSLLQIRAPDKVSARKRNSATPPHKPSLPPSAFGLTQPPVLLYRKCQSICHMISTVHITSWDTEVLNCQQVFFFLIAIFHTDQKIKEAFSTNRKLMQCEKNTVLFVGEGVGVRREVEWENS